MDSATANRHLARIIGTSVIVGVAGLAAGLQAVHSWGNSANGRDHADTRAENSSSAKPRMKPVPREQFPLTLANEPSARQAGVVNADHKELEFTTPDREDWISPFRRGSGRVGE